MKKLTFIFCFILLYTVSFGQLDKVAVVAINVNKHVEAGDFGTITAGLTALSKDPNFDLSGVVKKFRNTLFDDFSKDFTFDLLDESLVTGNNDYQVAGTMTGTGITDFYVTSPEGYQYFGADNKSKDKLIEIFGDQAQGIMYAQVGYGLQKKVEVAGFGIAYIQAWVLLQIFDENGDKIFSLRVYSKSSGTFKFALGGNVLEAKEIIPLCEEATDNAFIAMKKKLPKSIKKMNKKLAKK